MTTTEGQPVSVRLRQGTVHGLRTGAVSVFKGISYALPPFGQRRFAAPVPVAASDDDIDATAYGPTAPKPPYPSPIDSLLPEPAIPGEDCLNLNIWTSGVLDIGQVSLPVLVWIHGGAFANGSGAVSVYDGTSFARDGVVCVTINYRLGVDGFLLLDGAPANRGLLDQIAALEWVRDNIEAFGGDPGRVTIAGESAGAMSVAMLMAIPRAAGLFHGAIAQSGAGAQTLTPATARKVTEAMAEALGVEPTAEAIGGIPIPDLVATQARLAAGLAIDRDPQRWAELARNSMPFEPTVDGDVLPLPPLEAFLAGASRDVPLLIGTNRDEMTLFLEPLGLPAAATEEALPLFAAIYDLPPEGVAAYRAARPEAPPGELVVDILTDWFFRIPAIRLAEARQSAPASTFMYEFAWRTPVWAGRLRSTHALEVAFAFDTLDHPEVAWLAGERPPHEIVADMHGGWLGFVENGETGWQAYLPDRYVMGFDAGPDGTSRYGPVLDPRRAERAAWDGLR